MESEGALNKGLLKLSDDGFLSFRDEFYRKLSENLPNFWRFFFSPLPPILADRMRVLQNERIVFQRLCGNRVVKEDGGEWQKCAVLSARSLSAGVYMPSAPAPLAQRGEGGGGGLTAELCDLEPFCWKGALWSWETQCVLTRPAPRHRLSAGTCAVMLWNGGGGGGYYNNNKLSSSWL